MTTSYLHDSLQELAAAVLHLLGAGEEATVVFMDEPGEHHLVLRRHDHDVALEVKWFDEWASWNLETPSGSKTLLETSVSLVGLQREVANALATLLATYGVDGYKKKWVEHDFPLAEYRALNDG